MSKQLTTGDNILKRYHADCEECFGLCCVALPYAKSADFALDKDGGTPCPNLQSDYRCGIHNKLRNNGFRGCAVYECFGAGQKVSQVTYVGNDWRDHPESAKEMFEVFPIMQQLHEMLYYLNEALSLEETQPIFQDLQAALEATESLTNLSPQSIIELNVPAHRPMVNELLLQTSELVRAKVPPNKNKKISRGIDLLGAKLKGANLRGSNLRGAFLIAADLREADISVTDFIGADLRDADLSGANLTGSIFLTQAQINSAKGDLNTKLPPSLSIPDHWHKIAK
ncbi:pentapeptide repeat-containing protein [Neobacillus sp. NPDC097160]|uniref:pentapeptide repeat-containing protein n=1 Tax=Neobacillus sp. NPDC097160 TaxID=3364298 RepID=UPI0037F5758E